MKKSLLVLAPLMMVALTSCGGTGKTLYEQRGSKVLTKEVMLKNWSYEEITNITPDSVARLGENELVGFHKTNASAHGTIALVENDDTTERGIFSAVSNKMITKIASDSNFETAYVNDGRLSMDFAIVKNTEGKFVLYAQNGDVVYTSEKEFSFSGSTRMNIDDICTLTLNEDGKYVEVRYACGNVGVKDYGKNEDVPCRLDGSKLDALGLVGYVAYQDDLHVTVKKDDKKVAEFDVPYNTPSFQVGKYLFFSHEYKLPDTIEDFDYIKNGIKYNLTIDRFDLSNGAKKSMKLNGFYPSGSYVRAIKDKDGKYTYGAMDVKALNKNKVVDDDSEATYVIDADLNLHESLEKFSSSPVALEFNNKFYLVNMDSKCVYNENLELIGDYNTDLEVTKYNPSAKVFVAKQNGKYGLMNVEGKVVVPFVYADIGSVYSNGTAYAVNDEGKCQKVNFNLNDGNAYSSEEIDNYFMFTNYYDMIDLHSDVANKKFTFINNVTGASIFEISNVVDDSKFSSNYYFDTFGYKRYFFTQVNKEDGSHEFYSVSYNVKPEYFLNY